MSAVKRRQRHPCSDCGNLKAENDSLRELSRKLFALVPHDAGCMGNGWREERCTCRRRALASALDRAVGSRS